MSRIRSVSPQKASELVRKGAVLVDVREGHEHARERIPGARHHALSRLGQAHPAGPDDKVLIFHCKSGARTNMNAQRLAAGADCDVYLLEGGIDAWRRAGLPVESGRGDGAAAGPDLMRQTRIAAIVLMLIGVALGQVAGQNFYILTLGAGLCLMWAEQTGSCGLTRLLAALPWNRTAT